MPQLQDRLHADTISERRGVCLGLAEVINSAHKSTIGAYMPDLIPCVRDALCDEAGEVREAAGMAFHTLYRNVGR